MTAHGGARPGADLAWLLRPHLAADPRFPAIPVAVE
jgi:hypothetical protein